MAERESARIGWKNGFFSNTAMILGVDECLLAGTNLWNRGPGLMTTSKGFGASVANSGGVNPLLNVASGYGGLTGGGSVTQAFASGVYLFAGSGNLYVNGVLIGAVSGGTVSIWTGSAVVAAGLASAGAPTITSTGSAGRNNGAYSIAVTPIRSITGGEGTISPPSNTISVSNLGIKITALPGFPSGADKVGIYVTKRGFGDIGPYFHFYDVSKATVDAAIATGGYTIQLPGSSTAGWIDAQLGDLAPLDFGLPPTCTYVFVINSVAVAAGCYGGAGLSASYPNKPEAYPARFILFIPGGGTITMVKGSGIEGRVLVGTASSLNLVSASQSTISPIDIDPIWPTTGIASANQICSIAGELFAWVGTRGPVRSSVSDRGDPGDEATAFATPVMKSFAANGYTASNTTVVYDPASDTVFYCKGNIAIGYCRYQRQWHPVHTLPTTIVTAVTDTVNGRALLSDASGNLYAFETGTGTSWTLVGQLQGGRFISFPKTIIGARAMVSSSCRMDIYGELDITTPLPGGSNLTTGSKHGTFHHLNIQNVHSFTAGLSGSDSGGVDLTGIELLYVEHPVRI